MNIDEADLINLSKDELIEAYKDLQKSRDKVFIIASHDLRSPFSGLLGLSEMLASGVEDLSTDDVKTYVSTIHESLKNTYQLIENLFEWGRIERRKYNTTIETIPLKLVLEEVLTELEEVLAGKDIEIDHRYNPEQMIKANSKMFEFILKNLVSNAVKFSVRGSRVIISYVEKGNGCIVSVKDEGVGIEPENLENLFRIDSKWKTHGTEGEAGIGLGLIASGRYADFFGAEITAESTPGKGSTFSLILPGLPV